MTSDGIIKEESKGREKYIMNRIITLVSVMLIFSCFFSACGAENNRNTSAIEQAAAESQDNVEEYALAPLEAFSIGKYDNNTAKADDVFYLWSGEQVNPHYDEAAAGRAEVEFCGKTYTGKYQYSSVTAGNLYFSDIYEGSDGRFSIDRNTGEVDCIFPKYDDIVTDPDPTGYQDFVQEIAGQFITTDEYTLSSKDEGEGIWAFHYFRVIDGITVWDGIDIVIDKGHVVAFAQYMTKEFPEGLQRIGEARIQAMIEAIHSGRALEAIEKAISESGRKATFNQEYVNLVLLPGDQIGVLYSGIIEFEVQTQEMNEPTYASARAFYLVTEEGAVSLDYKSDVNTQEYVNKITLVDRFHGVNSKLIEGDAARSVQDIILHIPYGNELYDCSMNYVIIVGNTWYGYSSYDGYMNHEGIGLYYLSEELNETMKRLLSLSSENDEREVADAISVIDKESPDYPIPFEDHAARYIRSLIPYLPYGEEQYDYTARYRFMIDDTWYDYDPESGWLNHEDKGEYMLPESFRWELESILSEYKR